MLKENELGISVLRELKLKLETAQKQIKDLYQKLEEKNKNISELKEEIKKYKLKKKAFDNLSIESDLNKVSIIGLLLYNKNLDETINTINNTNLNLEEENKILNEKLSKMKNAIIELSSKLEKELIIKEKKNLKINENNSKLFDELQKKSKDLAKKLRQESMNTMVLRKEKYDLETICIKQEECIRNLKKKINFSKAKTRKSEVLQTNIFLKSNLLPQNIRIIGINQKKDSQSNNSQNNSGFLPKIK
jgi:hypothetical protein